MTKNIRDTSAQEANTGDRLLSQVVRNSRLGSAWHQVIRAVRTSFLYRWLSKEPETEVIVIDLRETWTIGPILRVLDALVEHVVPAVDNSHVATALQFSNTSILSAPVVVVGRIVLVAGLFKGFETVVSGELDVPQLALAFAVVAAGTLATRERRSWNELRETQILELLVAALEPPEQPSQTAVETETSAEVDNTNNTTDGHN